MGVLRKDNTEIPGAQGNKSGTVTGEKNVVVFLVVCGLGAQGIHVGISKPLFSLQNIVNIDVPSVCFKAFGLSLSKGITFCYNRYSTPDSVLIDTCLRGVFAERFQKRERIAEGFVQFFITGKIRIRQRRYSLRKT